MAKFVPSKYQKDIFNFILKDNRNAVVSAVAGSGKTTTLLKALDLIPEDKSVLFLAFNVSIRDELKKRIPENKNIDVKTVHGFGYTIMRNMYDCGVDEKSLKYRNLFWDIVNFFNGEKPDGLDKYGFNEEQYKYIKNIFDASQGENIDKYKFASDVVSLCNLSRQHLVNFEIKPIGVGEINKIAEVHSINNQDGESTVAWYLSKLGMSYLKVLDYTDMISLPILLNHQGETYDFVFIDECQDLNTCHRFLMQKAMKSDGGRFIAVGDPKQAIYGFAGADHESYQKLKELPNTIELPLSYTYRVSPEILNLVRHLNPAIIAHTKNRPGRVVENFSYKDIQDGDMVLCRNTFPVVALCVRLLSEGKKSYIIGSDIGKSLKTMILNCNRKSEEYNMTNVLCCLIKDKEKLIEKIMSNHTMKRNEALEDSQVILLGEKIQVIEALSHGIDDPMVVVKKIEDIFSDDKKSGICLSNVHKSKGLEAERVFIIHPDLFPSKYAILPWQIEQERNLEYVAYTRAKTTLGFVTDFDAFTSHKTREIDASKIKISNHIGKPGMKMYLELTVSDKRMVDSQYGGKDVVYDLVDKNGNIFTKWGEISDEYLSGRHSSDVGVNSKVCFYAIIKDHSQFRGNKITKLGKISQY
jgi:superfamily I DNA/RNA helicase